MSAAKYSQEAHLRVALHDAGRFQLQCFADLLGFDLYAGPHGVRNMLRSTWHESGKVHTHTPAGRQVGPPRVIPERFEGKERLFSGGYSGPDWSYRPKPDSATRRTLILEQHTVGRGLTLDIWAVEAQRADLVAEVLAEYALMRGIELISYALIDSTRPQLMAVASTLSLDADASFRRTVAAAGIKLA